LYGNIFLDRSRFDRRLVSRDGNAWRRIGLIRDIIVGVAGGLLGGWIATSLLHIGAGVNGINLASILVAVVGAVILLVVLRLLNGG
jgi:uncharacterized membrane protein YeaQ/YmgE (transglycosylase-associated protein family)